MQQLINHIKITSWYKNNINNITTLYRFRNEIFWNALEIYLEQIRQWIMIGRGPRSFLLHRLFVHH